MALINYDTLKSMLEKGPLVKVVFTTKKGGERREMYATLNFSYLEKEFGISPTTAGTGLKYDPKSKNIMNVWDVEEQDWRSFDLSTLTEKPEVLKVLPFFKCSYEELEKIVKKNQMTEVVFRKKDGTDRTMVCTLNEKFLKQHLGSLPPAKVKKFAYDPRTKGLLDVWDLEKNEWRVIDANRILKKPIPTKTIPQSEEKTETKSPSSPFGTEFEAAVKSGKVDKKYVEVKRLLETHNIVLIVFKAKGTGEIREMYCTLNFAYLESIGIKSTTSGKGLKFDPSAKGIIPVWDVTTQSWRSFDISTMVKEPQPMKKMPFVSVEKGSLAKSLEKGILIIVFRKIDGSEREMVCTLDPKWTKGAPSIPAAKSPTAIIVWDLEKKDWRSVETHRIVQKPTIAKHDHPIVAIALAGGVGSSTLSSGGMFIFGGLEFRESEIESNPIVSYFSEWDQSVKEGKINKKYDQIKKQLETSNITKVVFKAKGTGERREMYATLNFAYLKSMKIEPKVSGKGMKFDPKARNILPVWDVEENGWRSFDIDTLLENPEGMSKLPFLQTSYEEVEKLLNKKVVKAFFRKKDGSDRQMICTLESKTIQSHGGPLRHPEQPKRDPKETGMMPVFDLEKKEWRILNIRRMLKKPEAIKF